MDETTELTDEQLAVKRRTRAVRRAKDTHERKARDAREKAAKSAGIAGRGFGWFSAGGVDGVDGWDFDAENIKVSLTTEKYEPKDPWVSIDGDKYAPSGVSWTTDRVSTAFDLPKEFITWTTNTTLTKEQIDVLTGGSPKTPEPEAEVDLAVVCFRVRYFDSDHVYTYAATGIEASPAARRLWYVTGSDAPQAVTYDELLDWFTSNGRTIVEAWVATSWKKLVTDEEENE